MSPNRLLQAIRDYWSSLRNISHNARLYLLTSIFMAVAIGIQLVLFNLYILELGYNEDVIGQLAAFIALGVALGGIPAGLLYDRFGGKASFIVATIGMVLTMAALALSSRQQTLSLWAILHGLANSIFFVSIFPYITDQSTPLERAHLYGLNLAVWSGFRVIGNFVAGYLPGVWAGLVLTDIQGGDLQASLLTAAAMGALGLLPLSRMKRADPGETRRIRRNFWPAGESRAAILKSAFILTLSGVVIGLTQPFYNVFFKRVFAADTVMIGTLFSLSELTALVSALALPALVARWGLVRGPALIILLASPLTFAMGLPIPLMAVSLIFLLKVGLQWLGNTPLMNLVMEVVSPNDRGTMSGIRLVTNYGAQALAGLAGGWLVVKAGYAWLFAVAAVMQLLFGSTVWLLFRPRQAQLETSASTASLD